MRPIGRFRFFIGIIIVIGLVVGLTGYLGYTMSLSQSTKAELAATEISIGTDYGGLMVKQRVDVGDAVKKGQTLFEIQSTQLNEDLTSKRVTADSLLFSVDPTTNYILLKAPDDGVVHTVFYRTGSYVPASTIVANVDTADSVYVVAHFRLAPPDYARIDKTRTMELRFPDNTTKEAQIFSITLSPNDGNVDTVVKAYIKDVDMSNFQFAVGTPVNATLHLTQQQWYEGLTNTIVRLFQPNGK
ncbi:MAG: HlyD family efflux transporter periplasmic adaptor subunit [Candidatus Saccharimonas sp.]